MNLEGVRNLCAAVIESAVDDYKMHVNLGHIKDGRRTKKPCKKRQNGCNIGTDAADKVLHFFKAGGLDEWITIGGLRLDGDAIRSALNIK